MPKYENWTSVEAVDRSLLDADIHYLHGELTNENVSETIKWILSANLVKKPKRVLELYINTPGGDLYEMFALIDVMKSSYHHISTVGIGAVMQSLLITWPQSHEGGAENTFHLSDIPLNTGSQLQNETLPRTSVQVKSSHLRNW